MRLRATPLDVVGAVALAAMLAANVASACGASHAKSATAANAMCGHACTMSACSMTKSASAVVTKPAPAPAIAVELPGLPSLLPQPRQLAAAGLMAFLDPETGLVSGAIGDFQLAVDLAQSAAPQPVLTSVALPNGGVMLDLQGTMQDYMILTIDALGHRSFRCATDPRQALKSQAPAASSSSSNPSER